MTTIMEKGKEDAQKFVNQFVKGRRVNGVCMKARDSVLELRDRILAKKHCDNDNVFLQCLNALPGWGIRHPR